MVDVAANRAATASTLSPRLRRLLERAPPPPPGQPAVDLLVSTDTVRVGEQVDVVTAAWFPRDLRLQLRRPPTLQPPVIDGVWSYPAGDAQPASRRRAASAGRWYDLFVSHQVVFPLRAGHGRASRAPRSSTARRSRSSSSARRSGSRSRAGRTRSVVPPLPRPAAPPASPARSASALAARAPASTRPGAGRRRASRSSCALSGAGQHRALAEPGGRLAAGRARLPRAGGRAGRRRPRAASAGPRRSAISSCPIRPARSRCRPCSYPYFDLGAGRYLRADAAADVGAGGAAGRAARPPPRSRPRCSMRDAARRSPGGWRTRVPDWVWLAAAGLPPLLLALAGAARCGLRAHGASAPPGRDLADRRSSARRSSSRRSCPTPTAASVPALAAAVRAAGADAELAARVAAVRERLLARRYGPDAGAPEDAATGRRGAGGRAPLGGSLRGGGTGARSRSCCSSRSAPAAAARRARRPSSCTRAARSVPRRMGSPAGPPTSPRWPATGTTSARPTIGWASPGAREAAWLRARRLDPREPSVRRALRPDAATGRRRRPAGPGRPRSPRRSCCCSARWAGSPGWLGWIVAAADPGAVAGPARLRGRRCARRARAPDLVPAAARHRARRRHAPPLAARSRAGAGADRGRQRRAGRRRTAAAGCWCGPRAAAKGGCRTRRSRPSAARFSPCPPHRHPARRRRRSDRRGRGRRAPGLGGEGAGGERARRGRAPRARRARERRQDPHPGRATTAAGWAARTPCSRSIATRRARSGASPT